MKIRKLVAGALSAALLLTGFGLSPKQVKAESTAEQVKAEESTAEAAADTAGGMSVSAQYVAAMGAGWNLGNTFDGVDTDLNAEDKGEQAWGNPVVTRELIHSIKEKGFQSIRMPLTLHHRFTSENGTYTIDPKWLARYKKWLTGL